MTPRDRYGWPVHSEYGRPVINFLRLLFRMDIITTWRKRKYQPGAVPGQGPIAYQPEGKLP